MNEPHNRYPGAPPFEDDETSRKVFFGRAHESSALNDQIIANRLVVVYARSGAGKTSLLKAGVAPRLREEGLLPVFVRVNVPGRKPLEVIRESMASEAARQGIEYVPGRMDSLWHFFKTAELWREDDLLTPVLIFDQFEELFTLQTPGFREALLDELGDLIRGIRPPTAQAPAGEHGAPGAQQDLSDLAPAVRVVLSLREDFLGYLEEAADALPQILSQRFRLMPLSMEAARLAFREPSQVDDRAFATKPFDIPSDTVEQVLTILCRRAQPNMQQTSSCTTVEPFELQLICQHIERLAARRQAEGANKVAVTLQDLGGERGLQRVLKDFYVRVLRRIPSIRNRMSVRSLCERHLISPNKRRLSLEESEIVRIFRLRMETLRMLTEQRLLRAEQHADSVYYELSHDSLVEPILATRRVRDMALGVIGVLAGVMELLIFFIFVFVLVSVFSLSNEPATPGEGNPEETAIGILFGLFVLAILMLPSAWLGLTLFRRGRANLRRRSARRSPPPRSGGVRHAVRT